MLDSLHARNSKRKIFSAQMWRDAVTLWIFLSLFRTNAITVNGATTAIVNWIFYSLDLHAVKHGVVRMLLYKMNKTSEWLLSP